MLRREYLPTAITSSHYVYPFFLSLHISNYNTLFVPTAGHQSFDENGTKHHQPISHETALLPSNTIKRFLGSISERVEVPKKPCLRALPRAQRYIYQKLSRQAQHFKGYELSGLDELKAYKTKAGKKAMQDYFGFSSEKICGRYYETTTCSNGYITISNKGGRRWARISFWATNRTFIWH
jgi:hypothetical protein